MTYSVFGGTVNLAQQQSSYRQTNIAQMLSIPGEEEQYYIFINMKSGENLTNC